MTRATHASVCPHDCPSACALEVTTEDGRIVDVVGDRAHPFTRGVIRADCRNREAPIGDFVM